MFETKEKRESGEDSWRAENHNSMASKAETGPPAMDSSDHGSSKKGAEGHGAAAGGMGGNEGNGGKGGGDHNINLANESFSENLHQYREQGQKEASWSGNSPREGLHDTAAQRPQEMKHQ